MIEKHISAIVNYLLAKNRLYVYCPKILGYCLLSYYQVQVLIGKMTNSFNHLFKNCCNICDAEMTDEDRKLVSPQDFLIVCKKHRESAKAFQVDIERERLGFEKRVIV